MSENRSHSLLSRSWLLLLLLFLSVGIRVYIFKVMHPIVHTDSVTFLFLSELDMVRTPGYPGFIEAVLSINDLFSASADYLRVIVFAQLFVLGLLNVGFIYAITRFLTSSRAFAFVMGFLYNFNFFVVGFETQLMTETLAVTLLLAVITLYLRLFQGKRSWAVLAGMLMVMLIYTRATYLLLWLFLPFVTLVTFFPESKSRKFFKAYAPGITLFLIVSLMGIAGWSLRNKIKFDYMGISSLMPYQLRYYTNSLYAKYQPSGDMLVDRVAQVYAEEFRETGHSSVTVYNFHTRLNREMGLSDAQIASAFMKSNMNLIKDYPGEYLAQIPDSLRSYYMQYKAYWTAGNTRKFLNRLGIVSNLFLKFFQFYQSLFTQSWMLLGMLILAPLLVLIFSFPERFSVHGWCVILAVIHYTGFVSVLSTNAGINNLRYRHPVEPLILLMFYAAFFYLGRALFHFIKKHPQEEETSDEIPA